MARQSKILIKTNIYGKVLKKEFHVLVSELMFFHCFIFIDLHYLEGICKAVDLSFT